MAVMKVMLFVIGAAGLASCQGRGVTASDTASPAVGCTLRQGIQPSAAVLHPGDTLRLRMVEEPCNGVVSTTVYQWSSSNAGVAIVDRTTALVTALATGQATIIASAVNDPNLKSAMALQVVP